MMLARLRWCRWSRWCRHRRCRRYYRRRRPSRAPRRARSLPTTDVSSCPLLPDGRPSDAPSFPPLLRLRVPSEASTRPSVTPVHQPMHRGPSVRPLVHRNRGGGTRWHNSSGRATKGSGAAEGTAIVARAPPAATCCTTSTCSDTLPSRVGGSPGARGSSHHHPSDVGRRRSAHWSIRRSSQQTRSSDVGGTDTPIGEPGLGRRRGVATEEVRRHNLGAVLERLHFSGSLSRSELTAMTGLNRSTIADLLGELTALGLVEERPRAVRVGPGPSVAVGARAGPRARRCSPSTSPSTRSRSRRWAWGVTCTTRSASRDPEGGSRRRRRFKTSRSWRGRCWIHSRRSTPWPASASPSSASPGGPTASSTSLPTWDGETSRSRPCSPPRSIWASPSLPPTMPTSVRLAEHRRGLRPGIGDLIYVAGEFGIGAGVIVDGRPLRGAAGYAGEAGHTLINPAGRGMPVRSDRLLGDRGRRGRAPAARRADRRSGTRRRDRRAGGGRRRAHPSSDRRGRPMARVRHRQPHQHLQPRPRDPRWSLSATCSRTSSPPWSKVPGFGRSFRRGSSRRSPAAAWVPMRRSSAPPSWCCRT